MGSPPASHAMPEALDNLPLYLTLGSLAALLLGVAKAGFGGSIGLLAVPMMIYACGGDAVLATGIMLPVLMACDLGAVVKWRGQWQGQRVARLIPGVLIGIIAATVLLWAVERAESQAGRDASQAVMKLGIGLIALGFVGLQIYRWARKRVGTYKPGPLQGAAVGTVAGVTSTFAHSAGPVVAMYMLPQRMPKHHYVATMAFTFFLVNWMKVPTYVWLGRITPANLLAGAVLLPGVVGGIGLGAFLHHRLGQRSFTGIVYVLLAGAGVDLTIKGISALTR